MACRVLERVKMIHDDGCLPSQLTTSALTKQTEERINLRSRRQHVYIFYFLAAIICSSKNYYAYGFSIPMFQPLLNHGADKRANDYRLFSSSLWDGKLSYAPHKYNNMRLYSERSRYDDDNFEEEYHNQDVIGEAGNFWYNPTDRLDAYPSASDMRQHYTQKQEDVSMRRKILQKEAGRARKNREVKNFHVRTGLRLDSLAAPSGLDSADDRTVFGGTKGKLSGVDWLGDIEMRSSDSSRKRQYLYDESYNHNANFQEEEMLKECYNDDDEYDYEEIMDFDDYEGLNSSLRNEKTAQNGLRAQSTDIEPEDSVPPTSGSYRRNSKTYDEEEEYVHSERGSLLAAPSWFVDDEGHDEQNNIALHSSILVDFLDNLFQIDPKETLSKSLEYNEKLGLERNRKGTKQQSNRRTSIDSYKRDTRSLETNRISLGMIGDKRGTSIKGTNVTASVIDVEVKDIAKSVNEKGILGREIGTKGKKRVWKDREMDLELVPPKDVIAWGPGGEIDGGIEIRAKTVKKAKQDIKEAYHKLRLKEEQVAAAKENLIHVKSHAASLKEKLLSVEYSSSRNYRIREKIRVMNLEAENVSRTYRRAQKGALSALEEVKAIEERHWVLINQYEADLSMKEL